MNMCAIDLSIYAMQLMMFFICLCVCDMDRVDENQLLFLVSDLTSLW